MNYEFYLINLFLLVVHMGERGGARQIISNQAPGVPDPSKHMVPGP